MCACLHYHTVYTHACSDALTQESQTDSCTHVHAWAHAHTHTHTHTHIYTDTHTHTYTHTHIKFFTVTQKGSTGTRWFVCTDKLVQFITLQSVPVKLVYNCTTITQSVAFVTTGAALLQVITTPAAKILICSFCPFV